jgi:hypothetical protein
MLTEGGMTDAEIIAAIRKDHLKANIAAYEAHYAVHWDRARVDPGGTIFGPGPYLKVPVSWCDEELVIRVYPPARLRRRLAREAA